MKRRNKVIVVLLGAAFVLGLLAALASGKASATCHRDLPVTHTSNQVQMHAVETCGYSYRAWGDWGGKYRYGTYTKVNGNYSTACDDPGPCNSHPDGKLFKGGYQVKRTGKYVTTFTTSATLAVHTTALAKRTTVPLGASRRTSYIDIHNASCLKEQVWAGQTLDGNKTTAHWRDGYNGCLWYIRLHVHCGIPTRNIDYGWFYSKWIEGYPPVQTVLTCPNNSFGFHVYLQWKHHVSNTIYHRKLK